MCSLSLHAALPIWPISEARTRAGCPAGGCVFGRGGDVHPYGEPPMKMLRPNCPLWLTAVALVALAALPSLLRAQSAPAASAPVTVTDNGSSWTLDNGIVKATINKNNGRMA